MASTGTLQTAERILEALDAYESQGSLQSQAEDCAAIVDALGYKRLGDYLRSMASAVNLPPVDRQLSRVDL